jgi:hypothetical protein
MNRLELPPLATGKAATRHRTGSTQAVTMVTGGRTVSQLPTIRSTGPSTSDALVMSGRSRTSIRSKSMGESTRRGLRNPACLFRGVALPVKNSALPPAASTLPDMSNWRTPPLKQSTVASRMLRDQLDDPARFESPFKCETLRQPEPLRCTPIPSGQFGLRGDILDKPTLVAAAVRSLPRNASPILMSKPLSELTVPEMVRVLLEVNEKAQHVEVVESPAQRLERIRRANDPMEQPAYIQNQTNEFELSMGEKLAFGRFLANNKRVRIPVMVLRHFRHQLMEESALVRKLRALPLKAIEKELEGLGPRTINPAQWNGILIRLVGDTFSRLDAYTVFTFFDTDTDGDIDQRELCNGFLHLRSADGPMLSVLHRCSSFLQPNIKDTRLMFISRFEMVLMAEAIAIASRDKLSHSQQVKVKAALDDLLTSFSTNKRGEFPFDEVRRCVLRSEPIVRAIKSITVPREPELYNSPLSVYMRNGDSEDGEAPFRLMMSLKALDKAQRNALAASANGAPGSASGPLALSRAPQALLSSMLTEQWRDLDEAQIDSDDSDFEYEDRQRRAATTEPTTVTPAQGPTSPVLPLNVSQRQSSSQRQRLLSVSARPGTGATGGSATRNRSHRGSRRGTVIGMNNATPLDRTLDSAGGFGTEDPTAEEAEQDREVPEPDEPEFFTLRGTLYRKLAGEAPQPYWVQGMPSNVKYSENRRP